MNRHHTCLGLIVALTCAGCSRDVADPIAFAPRDESPPPLEIRFNPSQGLRAKEGDLSCGIPQGRDQIYDRETGTFHVHFKARDMTVSSFEITKVAARFPKPIVFRLTGVPLAYGCVGIPLALTIGEKRYAMVD